MTTYSQYGEEAHLLSFFEDQRGGYVVDVGAADGQTHSNSRFLIEQRAWRALLIEPLPEAFAALQSLYALKGEDVRLHQGAVSVESGHTFLHPSGQVSTIHKWWRERAETCHPDTAIYGPLQPVSVEPLCVLLHQYQAPGVIDLLTIDAEGADLDVLKSMDWDSYHVKMVILEGYPDAYASFLEPLGYQPYAQTAGNVIFTRVR